MIQGKARIVNRLKDIDTIQKAHYLLSEKYLQYKIIVVGIGDICIVIDIQKFKLEIFQLRKIDTNIEYIISL
ncbi:MAG TPA: hypothetical protein VFT83_05890 [Nitrososphaeraceae archaeon]|jgi:hypothetical protein|nr:hypothetical protein [Nitrososphaeraceae archaeon]